MISEAMKIQLKQELTTEFSNMKFIGDFDNRSET